MSVLFSFLPILVNNWPIKLSINAPSKKRCMQRVNYLRVEEVATLVLFKDKQKKKKKKSQTIPTFISSVSLVFDLLAKNDDKGSN